MSKETEKTPPPTMNDTSSVVKLPSKEEIEAIRSLRDEDLSWLYEPPERAGSKFARKARENPFVPFGKSLNIICICFAWSLIGIK